MAIQISKDKLDELLKVEEFQKHWARLSSAFNPKEQTYLFSCTSEDGRMVHKMLQNAEQMGIASWVDFQNRQMNFLLDEE